PRRITPPGVLSLRRLGLQLRHTPPDVGEKITAARHVLLRPPLVSGDVQLGRPDELRVRPVRQEIVKHLPRLFPPSDTLPVRRSRLRKNRGASPALTARSGEPGSTLTTHEKLPVLHVALDDHEPDRHPEVFAAALVARRNVVRRARDTVTVNHHAGSHC